MEFLSINRQGFCEEDQMSDKVELHYSYSSSSSSPSSSSSHHHHCKTQQQPVPLNNVSSRWERRRTNSTHQINNDNQQQIIGSSLSNNRYDPTTTVEKDNSYYSAAEAESTKQKQQLYLKDYTSPRNDEDVRSATSVSIDKEHMFDKVVTPSDVGKLNRLVIPKQHAEKYFPPLDSSSTNEKGLLLNFEDRNGKSWRSQPAATPEHTQTRIKMGMEWLQKQQQQQQRLQQHKYEHRMVFDSLPVVQGKTAAKRLRLFGVNMDCPMTESDECEILSSTLAIQPSQLSSSSSSQLRLVSHTWYATSFFPF